jgi:hypothetical protein
MRTQRITVDLNNDRALKPGDMLELIVGSYGSSRGPLIVVDVLPEGDGISAGDEEDA